jgi:hypothetical protein
MHEDRGLRWTWGLPGRVDGGNLVNVEPGREAIVVGQGRDRVHEVIASDDANRGAAEKTAIFQGFEPGKVTTAATSGVGLGVSASQSPVARRKRNPHD